MLRTYLLIAYRSLLKNRAFIIINVIGMGIAISCCLVGFLAFQYDNQFDNAHENRNAIYRVSAVRSFENTLQRFGYAPLPLTRIVEKISDVQYSSIYIESQSNLKRELDLFPSQLAYVNPAFFDMFTFDFIEGSPKSLRELTSIVVSETMAKKLFHSPTEAMNKMVTQVNGDHLKVLKITGVFRDQPMNSSFFKRDGSAFLNFENYKDEFVNMPENDWRQFGTLFLNIEDPLRVTTVHRQLQTFTKNNNEVHQDFQINELALDNFSTMAHRDRDDDVRAQTWGAPPLAAITGSLVMGSLILLIACFNLTNTAIAISAKRLKEIGIRKVMGSVRRQLITQFIGETILVCFIALIVGLALTSIMIEGWNLMTGNNIHLDPHDLANPIFIAFACTLLLVTGVIAGSYPAFYISRFQPISILKGKVQFGGTNQFTRLLLGLQFAISLISIVSAFGFFFNAQFQRNYDLGFDIRGSVIVPVNDGSELETFGHSILEMPKLRAATTARSSIGAFRMHETVKHKTKELAVDVIEVGDNYLSALDLKLTEGRDFIKESASDQRESVIITRELATLFGLKQPLGQEIIWRDSIKLYVIGVINDVYTQGFWRAKDPLMIKYIKQDQCTMIIGSSKAEDLAEVNENLQARWSKMFPNRLYPGRILANDLAEVDRLNMSIVYGYGFLGSVALLLSTTGLFSLLSLSIAKRMKEIGVRKILGASIGNLSRIINTEFVIILTVASILGATAGYSWSTTIMGAIWKYYQPVNLTSCFFAVSLMLVMAGMTIGIKIYSLSQMNPVDTFKDE